MGSLAQTYMVRVCIVTAYGADLYDYGRSKEDRCRRPIVTAYMVEACIVVDDPKGIAAADL